MTLVIQESDEVSHELLTSILGVLKKDNEVRYNLVGWICCSPCDALLNSFNVSIRTLKLFPESWEKKCWKHAQLRLNLTL